LRAHPTIRILAELRSALEDRVLFSLNRQLAVPILDGIDLTLTDIGSTIQHARATPRTMK
jgi:hypothetical protein